MTVTSWAPAHAPLGARCHDSRVDWTEWARPTAGPQVPPPWPEQGLVAAALELLGSGTAMAIPQHELQRGMIARWISDDFVESLYALGGPYILPARCRRRGCPGAFGKFLLDPEWGMAIVYDETRRPEERDVPRPWTKAYMEGKGYRDGPNTADANGTFKARCRKCKREIDLSPEYRTRRFLEALLGRKDAMLI